MELVGVGAAGGVAAEWTRISPAAGCPSGRDARAGAVMHAFDKHKQPKLTKLTATLCWFAEGQ